MKSHPSTIADRMIRAALRVRECRYRICAVGLDHRGRIINISTNSPRLSNRGWHAEELVIHRTPRSLSRILIARVGARGDLLAIDPCAHCQRLANKYGVIIERLMI